MKDIMGAAGRGTSLQLLLASLPRPSETWLDRRDSWTLTFF